MSDIVFDEAIPVFESIETLQKRSVTPTEPDFSDDDVVINSEDVNIPSTPRRRGRPKGSKNRTKGSLPIGEGEKTNVSGRLAKDVSLRTQQVLKGASSIPAIWRPAFQMHDIEATNIADPLASYATRQAELSPIVAKLIDDFDLVAAIIGVGAYAVRVYKENGEWIEAHADEQRKQQRRPSSTRTEPMGNVGGPVTQNQPTERPRQETEDGPVNYQPDVEHNPYARAVSVPYTGDL